MEASGPFGTSNSVGTFRGMFFGVWSVRSRPLRLTADRRGWPTCCEHGWHRSAGRESEPGSRLRVQRPAGPGPEQRHQQEQRPGPVQQQERGGHKEPDRSSLTQRDHKRQDHNRLHRKCWWHCRAGCKHWSLRNRTGTGPSRHTCEPSCHNHPTHTSEPEQPCRCSSRRDA